MSKRSAKPPKLKVVEIHAVEDGVETTDYLIADADASESLIMLGHEAIYCQVNDRLTGDMFVNSVNFMPDAAEALRAARALLVSMRKDSVVPGNWQTFKRAEELVFGVLDRTFGGRAR